MKLQEELLSGIEPFLQMVDARTVKRGERYFATGSVVDLQCVEPNRLYSAVVRGQKEYDVGLEFVESEWMAECSCPVGMDCKHIVAAMLALRERAVKNGAASTPKARRRKKASLAQPPRSVLEAKLIENLGRELRSDERLFWGSSGLSERREAWVETHREKLRMLMESCPPKRYR